jgi:hypothetical protein
MLVPRRTPGLACQGAVKRLNSSFGQMTVMKGGKAQYSDKAEHAYIIKTRAHSSLCPADLTGADCVGHIFDAFGARLVVGHPLEASKVKDDQEGRNKDEKVTPTRTIERWFPGRGRVDCLHVLQDHAGFRSQIESSSL